NYRGTLPFAPEGLKKSPPAAAAGPPSPARGGGWALLFLLSTLSSRLGITSVHRCGHMLGRVVLGRYEISQFLGHGSMGQVWLARDRLEPRPAVVKFLHEQVAGRPRFREQFRREMQVMAAFRHPHAVEF